MGKHKLKKTLDSIPKKLNVPVLPRIRRFGLLFTPPPVPTSRHEDAGSILEASSSSPSVPLSDSPKSAKSSSPKKCNASVRSVKSFGKYLIRKPIIRLHRCSILKNGHLALNSDPSKKTDKDVAKIRQTVPVKQVAAVNVPLPVPPPPPAETLPLVVFKPQRGRRKRELNFTTTANKQSEASPLRVPTPEINVELRNEVAHAETQTIHVQTLSHSIVKNYMGGDTNTRNTQRSPSALPKKRNFEAITINQPSSSTDPKLKEVVSTRFHSFLEKSKRMKLQLDMIDQNILFNVRINNRHHALPPELRNALLPAYPKQGIIETETTNFSRTVRFVNKFTDAVNEETQIRQVTVGKQLYLQIPITAEALRSLGLDQKLYFQFNQTNVFQMGHDQLSSFQQRAQSLGALKVNKSLTSSIRPLPLPPPPSMEVEKPPKVMTRSMKTAAMHQVSTNTLSPIVQNRARGRPPSTLTNLLKGTAFQFGMPPSSVPRMISNLPTFTQEQLTKMEPKRGPGRPRLVPLPMVMGAIQKQ